MRLPVLKDQSFCPVRASRANAYPSISPPKIKSPAVASRDEALKYFVPPANFVEPQLFRGHRRQRDRDGGEEIHRRAEREVGATGL